MNTYCHLCQSPVPYGARHRCWLSGEDKPVEETEQGTTESVTLKVSDSYDDYLRAKTGFALRGLSTKEPEDQLFTETGLTALAPDTSWEYPFYTGPNHTLTRVEVSYEGRTVSCPFRGVEGEPGAWVATIPFPRVEGLGAYWDDKPVGASIKIPNGLCDDFQRAKTQEPSPHVWSVAIPQSEWMTAKQWTDICNTQEESGEAGGTLTPEMVDRYREHRHLGVHKVCAPAPSYDAVERCAGCLEPWKAEHVCDHEARELARHLLFHAQKYPDAYNTLYGQALLQKAVGVWGSDEPGEMEEPPKANKERWTEIESGGYQVGRVKIGRSE